jgi:hypothetical protein
VGEVGVTADVIGRTAELEAVDLFLEWIAGGLASLVIDGDAGIGKTPLFRQVPRKRSRRTGGRG